MWQEFKEVLDRFQKFVLTTHVNPDGDGLGSQIALASLIRYLGKEAKIVNPNGTPTNYRFIDIDNEIISFEEAEGREMVERCQAIILLDCSDFKRLGREMSSRVRELRAFKACIDHHLTVGSGFDLMLVDERAPATGMLIYQLISSLKGGVNYKEALALYTAIMRETGSFRFSNTTPEVHKVVAELMGLGIDPQMVYEEVYEKSSLGRLKLLGNLLANTEMDREGRMAWIVAPKELIKGYGVTDAELDGFIDYPRALADVELVIFFIEKGDRVRISFRSKGKLDVNRLAQRWGGGGHKNASGATIYDSLQEAMNQVLAASKEALENLGETL